MKTFTTWSIDHYSYLERYFYTQPIKTELTLTPEFLDKSPVKFDEGMYTELPNLYFKTLKRVIRGRIRLSTYVYNGDKQLPVYQWNRFFSLEGILDIPANRKPYTICLTKGTRKITFTKLHKTEIEGRDILNKNGFVYVYGFDFYDTGRLFYFLHPTKFERRNGVILDMNENPVKLDQPFYRFFDTEKDCQTAYEKEVSLVSDKIDSIITNLESIKVKFQNHIPNGN
jgi:hypothetical protein